MSNFMRRNARKTGLAGLLALVLLLGLFTAASPVHADDAAAVFYGYVVAEPGGALPRRVRAISDTGVVCGSAEVTSTVSATAGFYALSVISGSTKAGCPIGGGQVYFVLLYGMIDELIIVGSPVTYLPGAVADLNLVRTAADRPLVLP